MVERLPQMHKALATIPKSSENTKCSRKTTISVVFITLDAEGLKGLGFKDLAGGSTFSSGLSEGFLPATLPNNFGIYKENRDSQSWQRQVALGSNGTLPSTKLGRIPRLAGLICGSQSPSYSDSESSVQVYPC